MDEDPLLPKAIKVDEFVAAREPEVRASYPAVHCTSHLREQVQQSRMAEATVAPHASALAQITRLHAAAAQFMGSSWMCWAAASQAAASKQAAQVVDTPPHSRQCWMAQSAIGLLLMQHVGSNC